MVGEHHQLSGHEIEQAPGDSERQGSLVCCGPWGLKESDMTSELNKKQKFRTDGFTSKCYKHLEKS